MDRTCKERKTKSNNAYSKEELLKIAKSRNIIVKSTFCES